MAVLVTGAGGFIGERLVAALSASREVVAMSRRLPKLAQRGVGGRVTYVGGSFDSFEDLRRLDGYPLDAVVHLAAATGGCGEEEGLAVNVLGTRRLLRYALDRGCRQIVAASSIAAVGSLDRRFAPLALPMADDHPCLAYDAYGASKALMEQMSRQMQRTQEDAGIVHLRLGSVAPDETWQPEPVTADTLADIPFVTLARVYAADAVGALLAALEAPVRPGVHVYNVVGPDISADIPTADAIRAILGERANAYDLSYYARPGNAFKPLYAMERIRDELGFAPRRSTRPQ